MHSVQWTLSNYHHVIENNFYGGRQKKCVIMMEEKEKGHKIQLKMIKMPLNKIYRPIVFRDKNIQCSTSMYYFVFIFPP